MATPGVDLLQFPYSHYNEKARWALDLKGVPHRRITFLPGPHRRSIKRLTGQTATPILRFGPEVLWGSARILDALEQRYPAPALYPSDPGLRRRALELQAWFDDEVGPMVRRSLFAVILTTPAYVCGMFSETRNRPTRLLYRAVFPMARGLMRQSMGITDRASIERADAVTREGLDFVAREAGSGGHLVGDTFTVADLTAAALLAPTADLPDPPMALPRPRPEPLTRWLARWAEHPGVVWVRAQYRTHRPPSSALIELHG